MLPYDILSASLREAGVTAHGPVGGAQLRDACAGMPRELASRLCVDRAGGAAGVALAYGEGPAHGDPGAAWSGHAGPLARLARFARADWYAELGSRLKAAAALCRTRLRDAGHDPGAPGEWRYFVNSRLPERRLALAAGLGKLGRHGLVMLPERGSAVVLGLLLLPVRFPIPDREGEPPSRAFDPSCEGCGACLRACPTGAIKASGFARELCLQNWSSVPGSLPAAVEEAWGDRLYGCDSCQEACPRFAPDPAASTRRGCLGPGLPAGWLAAASGPEIRAALKGSALGMGWIAVEALRRNAALALRHKTSP